MPSNIYVATVDQAWDILKHYPELNWSKTALENTLIFSNGYAIAVFNTVLDEAELLLIATHPDYTKQGYARSLLTTSFISLEVANIFLEVRKSNHPARKLYEALGFKEYGQRKHYYQDGEDAILYALPINK